MFASNKNLITNPEILKYIKQQTNKTITKLQEIYPNPNHDNSSPKNISNLVKNMDIGINPEPKKPDIYCILPFVSLMSFLAGYHFYNLIHK